MNNISIYAHHESVTENLVIIVLIKQYVHTNGKALVNTNTTPANNVIRTASKWH